MHKELAAALMADGHNLHYRSLGIDIIEDAKFTNAQFPFSQLI
jgi:hypothetical protein